MDMNFREINRGEAAQIYIGAALGFILGIVLPTDTGAWLAVFAFIVAFVFIQPDTGQNARPNSIALSAYSFIGVLVLTILIRSQYF